MPPKPAKSAKQASPRNVKMKTDEDFGKKTKPAVAAALASYKNYHGGKGRRGK